jgi:hypothetical protein
MADTETRHLAAPVEGDGVSYPGIVWFVVILTATTVFCMALVWGLFAVMDYRNDRAQAAPLAVPAGQLPPGPNLLTDEAGNLRQFRQREDAALGSYGWADQATETVRLPIARAKEKLLERGLPVRK